MEKKLTKQSFEEIDSGEKNFEVRLGNFEIEKGDSIIFKEIDNGIETGRTITKKVGFVRKTKDLDFWLEEDIAKFGFTIFELK